MFFSWKMAAAFPWVGVWSDILKTIPAPWNDKQKKLYLCYAGINTLWINPNEKELRCNIGSSRCKFLTTVRVQVQVRANMRYLLDCRYPRGNQKGRCSPQSKSSQMSDNYATKIFTCGRKGKAITDDYEPSMTVDSTAILRLQRAAVVSTTP